MHDDSFKMFREITTAISSTVSDDTRHYGDIYDLANAFLSIEPMTHKKLQKLCYYAKAWYLAINNENIITEPFEAWVHGAVQPALFQKYRAYGFQLIPMFWPEKGLVPEEFTSFAREIYESYGEYDGDELEKINHQEVPWINARKGLKPWQSGDRVISEDDMKTYYRGLMDHE
jgi:uncharacterized phage-associated protein